MSEREMKRLTSMTRFNYYYFHQQTSRNFAVFSSKIWQLLIIFIIFIYFYFPPFSIRWRWSVTPDFCQIPNLEGGFWEGPGMAGPEWVYERGKASMISPPFCQEKKMKRFFQYRSKSLKGHLLRYRAIFLCFFPLF